VDCFVEGVNINPFIVAQRQETWDIAQLFVPNPTPEVAVRSLSSNPLLCEVDCFVEGVNINPFIVAQLQDDFTLDGTIAEVAPLDRILEPDLPVREPIQPEKPDPTIETTPETTTPPIKVTYSMVEELITNAISNTAVRYPWITHGSDNLTFSPLIFKPRTEEVYLNLDIRNTPDNPVINKIGVGAFPRPHQLYWVLEDNIIVGEIGGGLAGFVYQGQQTNETLLQTLSQRQSFSGYQAVWVIPNDLQRLFKVDDLNNYQVISTAGQIINPEGIPAGEVVLNTDNVIQTNNNVVILPSAKAINDNQIGVASTFNPRGGGALFGNLDLKNAPLILQGFPTSDLRALAEVDFKKGAVISREILENIGISWPNPLTGERNGQFNPNITSTPGIKIAQPETFDNKDLLTILVNPFLDERQKNYHYWNSLLWVGLGVQPPELNTFTVDENEYDWYRLYVSALNNRFIIQYSPEDVEATFYNLFANPGFSLTVPLEGGGRLDEVQSINSTIGMLMGGLFDVFNIEKMNDSINEAKKQRNNNELFKPLNTKATSEERRNINLRLNTTLAYSNLASSLNQVSGYVTFPSVITPQDSGIFQIKTGNIQRAVQFVQSDVGEWREGETTVESARLSNRSFGPLTFLGNTLPIQPIAFESRGEPINESSASQVILISPEGQQFVQEFNSRDLTAIPTPIRTFDLAFDRIVLQKSYARTVENKYYNGYLFLPTIELAYTGTSDDWNYTVNTGVWFNIDNQAAGEVKRNDFGIYEPSIGVYVNAIVSTTSTDVDFDDNKQLIAINTHVPFLRFSWNSANNSSNPWQVTLAYTYSRQTKGYGLSLTSSLGIIPQYGNGSVIGLFNGRFSLINGPVFKGNVELGTQIYYNIEALQNIGLNLSIGPYLRNYIDLNLGFNSRDLDVNYGGIIEYKMRDTPISMRVELGVTEEGEFTSSIKGDMRF
jgi:hypothetical protein